MKERDYSKIDGIPNERWDLACVIYSARIREAWGRHKDSTPPPREGYSHNRQVCDFDLALASAKAVLAAGYTQSKGGSE